MAEVEFVTYGALCYGLADTLKTALDGLRVQPYDKITEGIPDLPLLQIYLDNAVVDDLGTNAQASFGGAVRRTHAQAFVDGYARQRSHLGEDLRAQMQLIDALDTKLAQQTTVPFFGLSTIKDFHWKWERATFSIGEGTSKIDYAGCRFTIDLWVW